MYFKHAGRLGRLRSPIGVKGYHPNLMSQDSLTIAAEGQAGYRMLGGDGGRDKVSVICCTSVHAKKLCKLQALSNIMHTQG